MRVPLLLVGALSGSSLVGCAVPTPDPGPDTSATGSTATAIIAVERTAGPGDAVRGDAVVARFVRVSQGAVDDPALRMAGVAVDLPALGTCIVPTENAPTMQDRAVELLDVGQVTLSSQPVDGAAKSTVLLPRSMPDPAGVVSGVFYSARSADVFAPSSRVSLRSTGGVDLLEGFNVTVTAPRDVTDVHTTPAPAGLDVTWDATDADARDLVYVDVLSPAPRVLMRCIGTDSGRLFVPQGTLPQGTLEDGQLAVHRLHKESFKAKGIEPGEVRFDIGKVVALRH